MVRELAALNAERCLKCIAVGDAVNLASRPADLTKTAGPILVSQHMREYAGEPSFQNM